MPRGALRCLWPNCRDIRDRGWNGAASEYEYRQRVDFSKGFELQLGWTHMMSSVALAGGALLVAAAILNSEPQIPAGTLLAAEPVRAEEQPAPMPKWRSNVTGSALSTAAFGLSALQPETYNGEIVLDIIDASPLDGSEKDRLSAKLLAAEAGHARLPDVLADIRLALAVE